jgi:hypothetical protein
MCKANLEIEVLDADPYPISFSFPHVIYAVLTNGSILGADLKQKHHKYTRRTGSKISTHMPFVYTATIYT